MITQHDISRLVEIWQQRLNAYHADYPPVEDGYKIALSECINDLLELNYPQTQDLSSLPPQEAQYYLESQEADSYLSSLEAHELMEQVV